MAGPGQPKTGGRKAGTPNRVTKIMRDAWLEAFERRGGVEYLLKLDDNEFVKGLVKMIPNEVAAKVDGAHEVVYRIKTRAESE